MALRFSLAPAALAAVMSLLVLCTGPAVAEELGAQVPATDQDTEPQRPELDFSGMGYHFPLRLHLVYGGSIEGSLGGVDPVARELLLLRPTRSFRVHFSLVESLDPLARRLPPDEQGRRPDPPAISAPKLVEFRWRPTWKSHVGAVMSFVVPGTGQFLHKEHASLGVLFLVSDLVFLAAGVLAFVGPGQLGQSQRRTVGGTFVGLALTTSVISSVHAFRAGRTRSPIPL